MSEEAVQSAYVEATDSAIDIAEEDHEKVKEIQTLNDNLVQVRQEIGRLYQVMQNLTAKANSFEGELSEERKKLASKYNLDKGQWALDFDRKQFSKVPASGPVIP